MKNIVALILIVLAFTAGTVSASESVGTILPGFTTNKVCQNVACTTYGSVNWLPTINGSTPGATAVSITDSGLTGNLWGNEIGWVNLAPTGAGVTINPATGALSGSAYANTGGWVNFRPTQVAGNPTMGVTINASGEFEGYAYVSGIKGGWMKFDCADPLACIKTDWRPTGSRTSTPAPTPTPANSVVGLGFLQSAAPAGGGATSTVVISNIYVNYNAVTGRVIVEWTTDIPTQSEVTYRASNSPTTNVVSLSNPTTAHVINFTAAQGVFLDLMISSTGVGRGVTLKQISFRIPYFDLITPTDTRIPIPFTVRPPQAVPPPQSVETPPSIPVSTTSPSGTPVGSAPKGGSTSEPPLLGGTATEENAPTPFPPFFDLTIRIIGLITLIFRPLVTNLRLESLGDAQLAIRRMFGFLTPRRRRIVEPWGTVYDSLTKRPLDPAYVSLRSAETDKEVSGAITDMAGRYGFLVPPGKYKLTAAKTHYDFPSKKLFGKHDDIVYDALYFGEEFTVKEEEGIVLRNIPLDAAGADWNEEEKKRMGLGSSRKRRQILIAITNTIFVFGFLYSVFALVVSPTMLNALIVSSYVVIWVAETLFDRHFRLTAVVKYEDGTPLPFALIKVLLTGGDMIIKKVVADQMGKYYMLVTPGSYKVIVEERRGEEYQKVYENEKMDFPKGIFLKDIVVK